MKGNINMEHTPIRDILSELLSNINQIADVDTVIGTPIETANGITLVPVSKVSVGFCSGGTDFDGKVSEKLKFGGAGGGGLSVSPIGFIVVNGDNVRFLPVESKGNGTLDKAVDLVPEVVNKIAGFFKKSKEDEAAGE